jgi:hypothetical protein
MAKAYRLRNPRAYLRDRSKREREPETEELRKFRCKSIDSYGASSSHGRGDDEPDPNAVPSLRSDSMMRNVVGNQIGPRQFELPPLSFSLDSAGSYATRRPLHSKGCASRSFDSELMP